MRILFQNFKESNEKRAEHLTEVWMSSCDVSQQSMVSFMTGHMSIT